MNNGIIRYKNYRYIGEIGTSPKDASIWGVLRVSPVAAAALSSPAAVSDSILLLAAAAALRNVSSNGL